MTTHTPTSNAELTALLVGPTAIAPGDVIEVGAGNWTTGDVMPTAGRLAGVTVRGAGRGLTLLSGGRWQVAAEGTFRLEQLTVDLAGVGVADDYGSMNLADGVFTLDRVEVRGANTSGNLLTFVASGRRCMGRMTRCYVHGANRDNVSTKAPGGQSLGEASLLQLFDCISANQGSNGNDQCLTSHDYFGMQMFHGSLVSSSPSRPAAAPDFAFSELLLWGTAVVSGTVNENVTGWWSSPE